MLSLPVCLSILAAVIAAAPAPLARAAEVIAHRGASHDAPENTLPAVETAWQQGADAVEVDIHLTADGKIAVIHDANTKRVTGVDLEVREATWEQLKELDAGAWRGSEWAGTRIPLLEEVIAAVPEGKKLVVEIKCGEEVLPELERVFRESGKIGQMMLIAFDYEVIRAAKKRLPEVPAYWLFGFSAAEKKRHGVDQNERLIELAEEAQLDGLDLKWNEPISPAFIRKLAEKQMRLYVYTLNRTGEARRLARMGVAGITTDRPAAIRQVLAGPQ